MFFNFFNSKAKRQIVNQYRHSTDNNGDDCLQFLLSNYRQICKLHSFNTFKEFSLNYRILFDRKNKRKIINTYKKYVLTKTKFHKSNLAISYNMINTITVDKELEQEIIDFMYKQLNIKPFSTTYFLKKHYIMDYVKTNFLTKTPK